MSDIFRSGRSPWPATPFIALATFCGLWALTSIVRHGSWIATTGSVLLVVSLVLVVTRIATRSRYLPIVVGTIASVLVLVPVFARGDEGQRLYLPTLGSLRALADTIAQGVKDANDVASPALVSRALACLITTSLIALFLVAEHIAVTHRAVASAGFLLILPWLPAVWLSHRVSTTVLSIAIAAWIAAMALARKNAPVERGISLGSAVSATTATVALMGLAVPAALGGPGWGSFPRFDTPDFFNSQTRLNLELDLRTSLTTNSHSPVLLYISDGGRPDALRLHTLTEFDGAHWDYDTPDATNRPATTGVLWPEPVDNWATSDKARINVRVYSLVERSLPLPTTPRTVDVDGEWTYDAAADAVIADTETTRDLQYSIVADLRFHDAATLRAADAYLEQNPTRDEIDPKYFDIAPAIDLERVRSLAEELTATAPTRYDKAMAIQNYLRNPNVFTYTTDVDPAPGDAVGAFLDSKQGYCVQFATTMVVMLRSIGIPARMGLGFLPGSFDSASQGYIVRGSDAHTWPEVYFPGHGWVRFEPTPAIQTGAPPAWADPYGDQIPVPRSVLDGGGYPSSPTTDIPDNPNTPVGPIDSPSGTPWWLIALGVVLSIGVAGVVALWWFRRRGDAAVRHLHGPEGAWQRLASRLGDLAWPSSATPSEATGLVLRSIERLAGRPAGSGGAAMTALGDVVSDHRYSPAGANVPEHQLDAWVDAVVAEADAATAETTDRPARGGARSAPRAGS